VTLLGSCELTRCLAATTAHGLAIGNLFLWLIPLVWGWFAITTQFGRRERTKQLLENRAAILQTGDSIDVGDRFLFQLCEFANTKPLNMNADEQRLGPFYNYARLVSWSHLAGKIATTYNQIRTMPREDERAIKAAAQAALGEPWNRFSPLEDTCWGNARNAFMCAFALQAFTGWSGFIIAYKTPTVGIGCRGFVILMYNILSLSACIMLISASYIYNLASLRTERLVNWFLYSTEVGLRNVGKFVALLNAAVILLSCFLQFTGVYNSCYCGSDRIGLGKRAYIIFPSMEQQAKIAQVTWVAGFLMATLIAIGFIIYFQLSKRSLPPNRR
jgi:hypothetical protein